MKILLTIALVAASLSNSVHAAEGHELMRICVDDSDDATCRTFVAGVMSAIVEFDVKTSICQPDGVNRSQNADVFVKYLNNHPGELHLSGAELVVRAVSEAFPCKGGK
jgi:hypothetical protein